MNKAVIIFIVSVLFFACNNTKDKQDENTAKDSSASFINNIQEQVKLYPESTGVRLQYAFALDSLNKYKESLLQMDLLTAKDSLNYGLWFAKGQYCRRCI